MMQISDLLKQHQLSNVKATNENGDTILHLVMKNERFTTEETVGVVQILLNEGVDPSIKNKNDQTVLHLAITKRAKDVIDCLLACKLELDHFIIHDLIEEENKKFRELINNQSQVPDCEMQKFENESASFVEWIVSKGLDIDDVHERYCDGPCALMFAIENDLQHVIPTLTKYTKNINFIKEDDSISDSEYSPEEDLKGTVLHLFLDQIGNNRKRYFYEPQKTLYTNYSRRHAANIVKMMLDKGVSTEVANGFGNTALHEAILHKENINIIEMLVHHTPNLNHKNNEGKTAFYLAIYKWMWSENPDDEYYVKISRSLVAKGADVNEPSIYGLSPLGIAVEGKNMRIIEFLRHSGADFSLIPKGGASMMHQLVNTHFHKTDSKKLEMKLFHLLIANGCPVNAKEKQHSGIRPLHVVANDGNEEIIRKLVEHGADVNCKDDGEDTPLHHVCKYNQYSNMAKLMLELGADVNAMNSEGDTPLHLVAISSRSRKAADMLKFLLENGADMSKGFSVIHWALWKDHNEDSWGDDVTELHDIPNLLDCIEDDASDEVKVLLRHWMKINTAKLKYEVRGYIDEDLKNLVKLKKYKAIHQKCLKEVEVLKSTFIDSRVSFYTYLHMDSISRCIYINNEKLKKLIDSSKVRKQFPEYAALILASYREAVTRKSLLDPVKETWLEITEIVLPDICIERIFSFLSNSDLFKFIAKN